MKINLNNCTLDELDGGFQKNSGPRKHVNKEFQERTSNHINEREHRAVIRQRRNDKEEQRNGNG